MDPVSAADQHGVRQLLGAVTAIGSDLDLAATLRRIVEAATILVDARYGALGVLDDEGTHLAEFITVGLSPDERMVIGDLPKGHGILGLLITNPVPMRLADVRRHPDSFGFPPGHPVMHSFLGVPVVVRGEVFGNLYLTDKKSADSFTQEDEELTVALAAAAGVAVENARLHARVRELAVLEDRERIAMDLHDTVIQHLFATGMSLQGTARLVTNPDVAARLQSTVDDLDTIIRQIRSAIFSLSVAGQPGEHNVRARVLTVVAEAAAVLGFQPQVRFEGAVDTIVTVEVAGELVVSLRESLSNVARHAKARHVTVEVNVDTAGVMLRVADDGVGPPDPERRRAGRGLANLATRARRLGGTFTVGPRPDGGTLVEWWAPTGR